MAIQKKSSRMAKKKRIPEDLTGEDVTGAEEDTECTGRVQGYFTNLCGFLLNFFLHFTLQK